MSVVRLSDFNSLADDMDAAIDAFGAYNKAKNLSPRTLEFYSERLLSFQRYIAARAPGIGPKDGSPTPTRRPSCLKRSSARRFQPFAA